MKKSILIFGFLTLFLIQLACKAAASDIVETPRATDPTSAPGTYVIGFIVVDFDGNAYYQVAPISIE